MYQRAIKQRILESLEEFRVVYIPGPRQAGKSTLVREISDATDREYVTLDEQITRDSAESDPEGFIDSFSHTKVSIDEIQYVPELVLAVKQISDRLTPTEKGKFLLTGSTDIFSAKVVSDRLPGHMNTLTLYPLTLCELARKSDNPVDRIVNSKFIPQAELTLTKEDLYSRILRGGYPEVQEKSERARINWFRSYIEARVLKDFEEVYNGRGAYIDDANALLNLLAGRCGNLISYNNLSEELGIGDEKTKRMTLALEQMFLVKNVSGYLKNRSKRLAVTTPKIYFVDTGLACYLLGIRTSEQLLESQYFGGLLENLIMLDLHKSAVFSDSEVRLHYFRDNQKREVDIVLEEPGGAITGVEIKAAKSIGRSDFSGLRQLANYAGSRFKQGMLLYSGDKILPMKIESHSMLAVPFSSVFR